MTDIYAAFYKTFLVENPQRVSGNNDFAAQSDALRQNAQDSNITCIGQSTFKLNFNNVTTYWVGAKNAANVELIVDTETNGNFCKIILTSKNPRIISGLPPYASDLYLVIAKDTKSFNTAFTSGDLISDDAERLWKGIVTRGGNVSVFDTEANGYVLQPVASENDLAQFIGDKDKRKYIFVLSETKENQQGLVHKFALMEIKRLAKWPLFDHLQRKQHYV